MRFRICRHCGKPMASHERTHMTVERLTQFAMLTAEEVEEQNRRAYGNFVPGSPARMNRTEAWMRGEPTCEECGKPRPKQNQRFCSMACRDAPGPIPTHEEILAEARAAHARLSEVIHEAGEDS